MTMGSLAAVAPGVELAGLFPAELQNWFENTAGVSAAAKQPDAAEAVVDRLPQVNAKLLELFSAAYAARTSVASGV